jgi:hypothetical protein
MAGSFAKAQDTEQGEVQYEPYGNLGFWFDFAHQELWKALFDAILRALKRKAFSTLSNLKLITNFGVRTEGLPLGVNC